MGNLKRHYKKSREDGKLRIRSVYDALEEESNEYYKKGGAKNRLISFGETLTSSYVLFGVAGEYVYDKIYKKLKGD